MLINNHFPCQEIECLIMQGKLTLEQLWFLWNG